MAAPTIYLCAECSKPLPPPKPGPGRRRTYCQDSCRKAASRRRERRNLWEGLGPATLTPWVDPDGSASPPPPAPSPFDSPAPPDEQLVVALSELHTYAGILHRLSRELRPQLAWRTEKLAQALGASLDDLFPVR